MPIQSFGENFDLKKLMAARELGRNLTHELASLIRPGMTEDEAHQIYKELCLKNGILKQWHPPKIRFGVNTTKNFKDISLSYTLQTNDLFFIDIGPIIDGHEADYGDTFCLGSNFEHKRITEVVKEVFEEVKAHWQKTKVSGTELYQYAQKRASHYGYTLNPYPDGHRIGDFPHHVFFKGGLTETEEVLVPNAWILEIHLLEKNQNYGAFFEDLLN